MKRKRTKRIGLHPITKQLWTKTWNCRNSLRNRRSFFLYCNNICSDWSGRDLL